MTEESYTVSLQPKAKDNDFPRFSMDALLSAYEYSLRFDMIPLKHYYRNYISKRINLSNFINVSL